MRNRLALSSLDPISCVDMLFTTDLDINSLLSLGELIKFQKHHLLLLLKCKDLHPGLF